MLLPRTSVAQEDSADTRSCFAFYALHTVLGSSGQYKAKQVLHSLHAWSASYTQGVPER